MDFNHQQMWTSNAEETLQNQSPPVSRISLYDLQHAPVDWEKLESGIHGQPAQAGKKSLRPHQTKAVHVSGRYFQSNTRGRLIMACGTGNTFTYLRITENETGGRGLILFLVPSIALHYAEICIMQGVWRLYYVNIPFLIFYSKTAPIYRLFH